MSEHQHHQLIAELRRLNRTYQRVHAHLLAVAVSVPERTVRGWLGALEARGHVARPHGRRSGWIVVSERTIL